MNKKMIRICIFLILALLVLFSWNRITRAHIDAKRVTKITIINSNLLSKIKKDDRANNNSTIQYKVEITDKEKIKEIVKKVNSQRFIPIFTRPKMTYDMNVIINYSNTDKVDNLGYSKFFMWKNDTTCKLDSTAYSDILDLFNELKQ